MRCPMNNQKLINFLNQLLSNEFIMYVKLHRYHWYVEGKHFFQLHEMFEEMYNFFADELDTLAERILAINGQPFATMIKYIKEATLDEANADNLAEEMITQLIKDYQQIVSEINNSGIPSATSVNDEPTIDLLISCQAKLEKYIWTLEAYQSV